MNTELIVQGVTIGFIVVAVLGFIRGFFKGTFRSLTDILFVIFTTAISILASSAVAKTVTNVNEINVLLDTVNQNLGGNETVTQLQTYISSGSAELTHTVNLLMALLTVIIAPLVFIVVYLLVGLLLKIPKMIIQKLLIPKTKNIGLRLLGGAFGAVRYVLAVGVLLVPIVGYLNYACDTIDSVEQAQIVQAENGSLKDNEIVGMLYTVKDSAPVKAVQLAGGKWLFNTLTTVDVDGTSISLNGETQSVLGIYSSAKPLLSTPLIYYGDAQIEALDNVINNLENSHFLTGIVSGAISSVSKELLNNGAILGYELPDLGDTLNPYRDRLLKVLASTNEQALIGDIRTVSNVISHSIENGVIREVMRGENRDILSILSNDIYMGSLMSELYKNERTRPMLPIITAFITNYVYDVYDEINGTQTPDFEELDLSEINEQIAFAEGERIAKAVDEIKIFLDSLQLGEDVDILQIIKTSDFGALGRGMNQVKQSKLFGELYNFLLRAILHSEACAEFGIFDEEFIENASNPDADMEAMLLARQHLVILTEAMWHGNSSLQAEALEMIIASMMTGDDSALKKLVTTDNLESFGITGEKAETISGIITSVIDSVHSQEFESEEEKQEEAEKTGAIISAINNSIDKTGVENTFISAEGEDSKTGKTADEFVDEILDSKLASMMVEKATTNENGEIIDDPYNIHSTMSAEDDENLKNAILDKYDAQGTSDSQKQTLEAIAHIFGIILVP